MANKHMERCSTSLIIREMQIKITVRYHFTSVRMLFVFFLNTSMCSVLVRCGEKGTLVHCWWECKLVQPLWKTVWKFLKKLKVGLHMIQQFHTSGYRSQKNEDTHLK